MEKEERLNGLMGEALQTAEMLKIAYRFARCPFP
jgi:hypothetical protein